MPDGSVISFPATGVYLLNKGIEIANRHDLVFQGNGATLKVGPSGAGSDQLASPFVLGFSYPLQYWAGGNTNIAIYNFNLVGNDPTPGVYTQGTEGQSGIQIIGTTSVEVSGCTISAVWGDGLFADGPTNVWLHNNHVVTAGRQGLTVIAGTNITTENNAFDTVGYVTFDVEADVVTDASTNIIFRNNTAGTWGQDFAAVEGSHTGAPINGITISGNTVTGGTLHTVIDNGGTSRMQNIVFTNNTSTVAGYGPVLTFAHIDGLTVTGNVEPLTSGSLASITDCTGVTYP